MERSDGLQVLYNRKSLDVIFSASHESLADDNKSPQFSYFLRTSYGSGSFVRAVDITFREEMLKNSSRDI